MNFCFGFLIFFEYNVVQCAGYVVFVQLDRTNKAIDWIIDALGKSPKPQLKSVEEIRKEGKRILLT